MPAGMLSIVEDDTYYYDAEAADRPCRFIEKYIQHYQGRHAGKPFLLHPLQRKLINDVYGWKSRETKLRRFTDVWFEAAVGIGKSPLWAALGIYNLGFDGEKGAQQFCIASNHKQAAIIFDMAKRFIQQSDALSGIFQIRQYGILHPKSGSIWHIVSGKGPKAGLSPSTILADEIHEMPNRKVFDTLRDRMTKRSEPLVFAATNAGESTASFAYHLHEKAMEVLENPSVDFSFYPVVLAAPEEADVTNWESAKASNPLIGITIGEEKIKQKCIESQQSEEQLAEYKRLYLTWWPKASASRWLDMNLWDGCAKAFNPTQLPTDTVLYDGLDISLNNDLSAAVFIWCASDGKMYVDSHFWMPRARAEEHAGKFGVSYLDWAKDGFITLVDSPTIDGATKLSIAAYITAKTGKHKLKAVGYDKYKADAVIAALEGAGVPCVAVRQGWELFPGCEELDRRLQEGSIQIQPNPVLRFCAENAEVTSRGQAYWPIKPNAKGTYAGTRWCKIDGITALASGLVEARKYAFPKARKMWSGVVTTVSSGGKEPAKK